LSVALYGREAMV